MGISIFRRYDTRPDDLMAVPATVEWLSAATTHGSPVFRFQTIKTDALKARR